MQNWCVDSSRYSCKTDVFSDLMLTIITMLFITYNWNISILTESIPHKELSKTVI